MKSIKLNAILNVIQNIFKVIFPLITIPYASRVLGATNSGRVSFGNSIVRYFILLAALGVATYAQREAPSFRDDKEKISKFSNQVFSINVYSTILSYLMLFVAVFFSYKLRDYSLLILLQSTSIILTTLGADWINVIYEDYLFITVRYAIMQCVALGMLFLFVKTPSDYYMYALIMVIASVGGNFFNIFYIRKYVHLKLVNPKECVQHLKPILFLFCVSITTIIYISSDVTILGFFMSDSDVGIYTLAANIYSVVKQVISAVIVVSLPRLALYLGKKQDKEYISLAKKVIDSLISLLFPSMVGLAFLSYELMDVMGGEEYVTGNTALIILAIALLFAILAGFYANCYLLLAKKDKTYLMATVISACVNIGLNFVLIPKKGIIGAALTTVIAEIIIATISITSTLKTYRLFASGKVIVSAITSGIIVGVICKIVCMTKLDSIMRIIVSFAVSVVLFYVVMTLFKNPIVDMVNKFLRRIIKFNK